MIDLRYGDCLELMSSIPDQSIDAVISDIPYGTTACAWDTVIPFAPMWEQLKRIAKPRAAIVLFGSQPFTSALVMSNPKMFKWEDIWHKTRSTGHLNANVMPLREHENILVFGNGAVTYNPQITNKPRVDIRPLTPRKNSRVYGAFNPAAGRTIAHDKSYPRSVIRFNNTNTGEAGYHPTQKPLALMKYLVLTYSNEGDTVLDFTMGSGTTGVACVQTGRNFIGCELKEEYFAVAEKRIAEAQLQLNLF